VRWRSTTRWIALSLLVSLLTRGAFGEADVAALPASADVNVAEMQQQVAQVRGLPGATTPVVSLDRATMVTRLSRPLNTQRAIREFLTSQMLLEVLGATPQGFDLRQLQIDLLSEQLLALYDHGDHTIYLVTNAATGPTERLTVAHELTHALQDQSFDLGRLLPEQPENGDVGMAVQALVEGDAMVTMRIWGRQYLRPDEKRSLGDEATPSDPIMDAAPPFVRGELTFPYDAGWVFAQLLYQDGGFDAINQAFQDPPRSTEQILHPEKYAAREPPIVVAIPPLEDVLPGTWTTRRTDVLGELVLRLLLEPRVGWPVAEAAAAGWGGDAYTILEDDNGRRIVGFVTVWDSAQDAAEFYNAYVSATTSQYASAPIINEPSRVRWAIPSYQLQVLQTGSSVRLVYAPDASTLEAVDAQLSSATVSSSRSAPAAPRQVRPPSGQPAGPASSTTPTATVTVTSTTTAAGDVSTSVSVSVTPTVTPTSGSTSGSEPSGSTSTPTPTMPTPSTSNDNSE
jgi:hypothetical protein